MDIGNWEKNKMHGLFIENDFCDDYGSKWHAKMVVIYTTLQILHVEVQTLQQREQSQKCQRAEFNVCLISDTNTPSCCSALPCSSYPQPEHAHRSAHSPQDLDLTYTQTQTHTVQVEFLCMFSFVSL